MQIVAMMMSDMGSSDRSPPSGVKAKPEPDSSSPVTAEQDRARRRASGGPGTTRATP